MPPKQDTSKNGRSILSFPFQWQRTCDSFIEGTTNKAVLEGARAYQKLINVAHVSGAYNVGSRGGEITI
jgi:hypothetical protein